MAIDTAAKRKAALNFGRYTGVMPLVDGDIANALDRQAALGGYIGIPVSAPTEAPTFTLTAATRGTVTLSASTVGARALNAASRGTLNLEARS